MNHNKSYIVNVHVSLYTVHCVLLAYFGSTALNGLNPGVMSIDISKVNNRE